MSEAVVERGELSFDVDARVLRELGERLVRRPETALIELIKNAYDADATECRVSFEGDEQLTIADDGHGMTLNEFKSGWMTIGTSIKASRARTATFNRPITGEKGIGRFSVRFLGEKLEIESIAEVVDGESRQLVRAWFDWPEFDESSEIGSIQVPYEVVEVRDRPTGTTLVISGLRIKAADLSLDQVRTSSMPLVSPLRSLVRKSRSGGSTDDPGFRLVFDGEDRGPDDVARRVLEAYELRATLALSGQRLQLEVFAQGDSTPRFELTDTVRAECGDLQADIRFFPRRKGRFQGLGMDGRDAYSWVRRNSGVAVFDRGFRVAPYGEARDDWLRLTADAARNRRDPRSPIAQKHFPMSESERTSTADNWMLRLPESAQLIGVVEVAGVRGTEDGLIAAADREGFVANEAFAELRDLVRGAVEALAMIDRRLQREAERRDEEARLKELRGQAAEAAEQIQANPAISPQDKRRLTKALGDIVESAEEHGRAAEERVRQLEVMSLLGVVAGFMTHEFGVALDELRRSRRLLAKRTDADPTLSEIVGALDGSIARLDEFVDYSTAYVRGARTVPSKPYTVVPRIRHLLATFGQYAEERSVVIESDISRSLKAPLVPTSLYDGVLLNLLTNALKATTALTDREADRRVAFRAWNEKGWHYLEVADSGIGIPAVIQDRIFDPLFSTTLSSEGPLGSGMGLGLSLVRAGVEAFGGRVDVVDPPPDFATCVRVRLPLGEGGAS